MPTIKGFSTKDPGALKKVAEACGRKENAGLPFEAKGWKSDKNSELVREPVKKKIVKKKKAVK